MKQLFFVIIVLTAYTLKAQPAWQQRVDTKIDVQLDDNTNFLNATEEITYFNNSPDTLHFIYLHLWPNAYKHDHTPFERQQEVNGVTSFYYSKEKDKGYIDSIQFTIDGSSADYSVTDNVPDIARIDLVKPLLPGRSLKIETPFRVKIPKVFSRMGHTGQAYYISQWFPKPAVYDQKGWHPISYLDQGEFYSEFGSYDVSITLPANYVLMATGNCLDEKENAWLDEKAKQPLPADTTYEISFPPSSGEMKTVHFHEENVHDFAWFADKRWVVRKDTVHSPVTGNLVTTWTAFMPRYQKEWAKSNEYLKETIKHYGEWVGPYPYKTMKAVLGDMRAGGGMEYPTVTVIDKSANTNLSTTIIHEAGHNWFYGMLGSNERDHAWMDEGINTFFEGKTTREIKHDTASLGIKVSLDANLLYYENVAIHKDQAIDQTSANFTKNGYGIDVYYKTNLMLIWLEDYIGKDDFEAGIHDYYNTWRYHHPYPDDFRTCMQRHTSKPIGWFFDPILTTDKRIDFKITNATINGGNTEVTIQNNTGVLSPVHIDAYSGDSLVANGWSQPFDNSTTITLPGTAWSTLRIDKDIPDGKSANNEYRRHAIFHDFGIKVNPFLGLNIIEKDKLFIAPAWGYNDYDHAELGLLFHNLTIPENRFRFALAPMYAFATNTIVGAGSVGYLWYPENVFKEIMIQADGKTFHDNKTALNLSSDIYGNYTKVAPSVNFTFNEHDALSPVTRTLLLKGYNIMEQSIQFGPDSLSKPTLMSQTKMYGLARYRHQNDRTYNPFSYSLEAQAGADFSKLMAEGTIRIDYNVKNKSLYLRGFAGEFIPISSDPGVYSRYALNASYTGVDDYLYDGTYRGRNSTSGIGPQQISMQEGGFKVPTFNSAGRSDSWMATLNMETDLPLGNVPLRLFFDAGLIPNANPTITHASNTTLLYDGGVELYVVKNICSIYLPLIMSDDFQNYIINNFGRKNLYTRSISFTLQLQNINWLKEPSHLLKGAVN